MSKITSLMLGLTLACASLFAHAERTLTDQLGRQSPLPDHVTRAVVLQHQTLNLLVQLNAADDVVGVLSSWKSSLARTSPALCLQLKRSRCRVT